MRKLVLSLLATLVPILGVSAAPRRNSAALAGIPFVFDSGRILLDVVFTTPDGRERNALAWFNMGMPSPMLTTALYHELGLERGAPLRVSLDGRAFEAGVADVVKGDGGIGVPTLAHLFAPRRVEAMLPAKMFQEYVVSIDYARRRFALSAPGQSQTNGAAVPIHVNAQTGVVAVEALLDGEALPVAIDAGAGYSWMRGDARARPSRASSRLAARPWRGWRVECEYGGFRFREGRRHVSHSGPATG